LEKMLVIFELLAGNKVAGTDIHDPEPRAKVATMNDGKVKLSVTAFLPTRKAYAIEQKALHAGLAAVREQTFARGGKIDRGQLYRNRGKRA